MDQPLFFPEDQAPQPGADSGTDTADLAAAVASIVADPRAWFAREVIEADGLDAPAGRVLSTLIEDVVECVFTPVVGSGPGSGPVGSDRAVGGGRVSRADMVSFVQAASRQMARMEALRAWAMAMLT